ncbi:MAG: NAD-dependent epimerase/dehydratase family protein, partial [Patescibacteria group bacterium]
MKNNVKLKGSNVLITGGCGFIGLHLTKRLVDLGVKKITIIDSLEYGKKENLGDLINQVEVIKYRLGSSNNAVLAKALKNVDYLFHLAAEKHMQSIDVPLKVLESNVKGTLNLLELAGQNNVKKVFYSSSVMVYGWKKGDSIPYSESKTTNPETVYGISKLAGEH